MYVSHSASGIGKNEEIILCPIYHAVVQERLAYQDIDVIINFDRVPNGYGIGINNNTEVKDFRETAMEKWFHPELFMDFDPKEIHQEYLSRFMDVECNLDKQGVFVYPKL